MGMDLVSHNFVEEVTTQVQSSGDDGEPAAKKQKTIESETKSVKKEMAFVSLAETLKVDWSSELYSKRIRRMDPSFFLLHVLFAFRAEMGHNPRASARDEDLKKLQQLRETTLTKLAVPTSKIPDEMLGLLFAELAPVAAIVGGILGQEVIKAISNKNAPHNNYFFYNPLESCGVVETIGYRNNCIKRISSSWDDLTTCIYVLSKTVFATVQYSLWECLHHFTLPLYFVQFLKLLFGPKTLPVKHCLALSKGRLCR